MWVRHCTRGRVWKVGSRGKDTGMGKRAGTAGTGEMGSTRRKAHR